MPHRPRNRGPISIRKNSATGGAIHSRKQPSSPRHPMVWTRSSQ
ncbi:MAG: hypothetical protein EOP85_02290 [Verrucomicrobiaceae bacterium]|nr:MAG: hypothetical protein EOP85_02290 [Verrucomicrobiaceae bacterium]